ncbi:hypothetical protein GQX74_010209 [Glossina fuscipes]|nr:hypothetical protein GQX74_010209 [Glossina fuscipes]
MDHLRDRCTINFNRFKEIGVRMYAEVAQEVCASSPILRRAFNFLLFEMQLVSLVYCHHTVAITMQLLSWVQFEWQKTISKNRWCLRVIVVVIVTVPLIVVAVVAVVVVVVVVVVVGSSSIS